MRDIRAVLKRWGEWAAHEENRSAWPTVCATFRGVLAGKSSLRLSCTDDDGLIIDACVSGRHIAGRDAEREVLFAYYVLRLSQRDVADLFETNRMQVRNLLSGTENFVNGGLVVPGVRLDMDLVLKATGQMRTPAFLLSGFEDISGCALAAG
ncbi:antitermination protein Q [Erwinia tracheiphila]|uniref:Antitermination protein Q n=1 Tax=Erwinia tracheiphila TaxID=65700 RepID=A0A345CT38_9GAMM|nr:antiterminator Q family protein [Erwinia tracheiphila]AXF76605.1 antitermination protein Q [Erwinia tracheiphila]UIA84723.1 antitermination protein Q [Erwinia tracheiphila]UIA93316.1 antitermination protein Q [Erwinia tracheiphila]